MGISVECACGNRMGAPTSAAGKTIRCPKCGERCRVPADDGSISSPLAKGGQRGVEVEEEAAAPAEPARRAKRCPDCGARLPAGSTACPHCTQPPARPRKKKKPSKDNSAVIMMTAVGGVAVMIIGAILAFIFLPGEKKPESARVAQAGNPIPPPGARAAAASNSPEAQVAKSEEPTQAAAVPSAASFANPGLVMTAIKKLLPSEWDGPKPAAYSTALVRIGADSVPPVAEELKALSVHDLVKRSIYARTLAKIGPDAKAGAPFIVDLFDKLAPVRVRFGKGEEEYESFLTELLERESPEKGGAQSNQDLVRTVHGHEWRGKFENDVLVLSAPPASIAHDALLKIGPGALEEIAAALRQGEKTTRDAMHKIPVEFSRGIVAELYKDKIPGLTAADIAPESVRHILDVTIVREAFIQGMKAVDGPGFDSIVSAFSSNPKIGTLIVDSLLEAANSNDDAIVIGVTRLLAALGPLNANIGPALAEVVSQSATRSIGAKLQLVRAIGQFGPEAKAALPALRAMRNPALARQYSPTNKSIEVYLAAAVEDAIAAIEGKAKPAAKKNR